MTRQEMLLMLAVEDLSLTAWAIAGLAFWDGRSVVCFAIVLLIAWGQWRDLRRASKETENDQRS